MYARIVVPLDGSSEAERALPWARAIAERCAGDLRLVHVHVPLRVPAGQEVLGVRASEALRRIMEETRDREAAYLQEAGERFCTELSQVTTAVLRGPPAAAVARDARLAEAGLVVMAPRDLSPLERWAGGSMTEQVWRACPVPVLAIPGPEEGAAEPDPSCRQIVVLLDGTVRGEAAVCHAEVMAELFGASILLLQVVHSGRRMGGVNAAGYLEDVADAVHREGLQVETRVVKHRNTAEAVHAVAEEVGAGMVALGSRYRNGFPRLARGGTAEAVLRCAEVPILLAGRGRPRSEPEAG